MNAADLLTQAEAIGVYVAVDGNDLLLRFDDKPPADLIDEIRDQKSEVVKLLRGLVALAQCRDCTLSIAAGTTLCLRCGIKRSALVCLASELNDLTAERMLRGHALVALDRRRYPRIRLADGSAVGPGLLLWGPVLREASSEVLREIISGAATARRGGSDD